MSFLKKTVVVFFFSFPIFFFFCSLENHKESQMVGVEISDALCIAVVHRAPQENDAKKHKNTKHCFQETDTRSESSQAFIILLVNW